MADDVKDPKKPQRVTIEVDLDDAMARGQYVNMARIFHNQTEFILDGLFLPPQSKKAHVLARLLLSPVHAKFLHAALGQNIRLYEQKFGEIKATKPGSAGGGGEPGPILH